MSAIEWTGKTWNPMVGCSKISAGCKNCYAMGDSPHRFADKYDREGVIVIPNPTGWRPGLTYVPSARVPESERKGRQVLERFGDGTIRVSLGKGAQWTGEIRLLPWQLDVPLRRRKPTVWFVNSLSDLFHEAVVGCNEGRRFIAAIFGVMAATPQHTYQILTKRPDKAREWFAWLREVQRLGPVHMRVLSMFEICWVIAKEDFPELSKPLDQALVPHIGKEIWPLPNVWIGTSVEDQAAADERIPELLRVPAAVRFLSCEPLLGPVRLTGLAWTFGLHHRSRGIDWAIVGGESGAKARPCDVAWIRALVEQCKAAGVPCFVKQLGSKPIARGVPIELDGVGTRLHDSKGADMSQWPEDLRVRKMPRVRAQP